MRLTRNIQIFCAFAWYLFYVSLFFYMLYNFASRQYSTKRLFNNKSLRVVYLSPLLPLELFRAGRCCKSSWYCSMEPSSCLDVNCCCCCCCVCCCCCEVFSSPASLESLRFWSRFDFLILSRTRLPSREAASTWLTLELFR